MYPICPCGWGLYRVAYPFPCARAVAAEFNVKAHDVMSTPASSSQVKPLDVRVAQKLAARSRQLVFSQFQDIASVGYGQALACILLDQQERHPSLVHVLDVFENLVHNHGSQPQRGFVQENRFVFRSAPRDAGRRAGRCIWLRKMLSSEAPLSLLVRRDWL